MELTWLDPDHLDRRDVDGAVAVLRAARIVDCPRMWRPGVASTVAHFRHGWDGDPPEVALARGAYGRVVGVLRVSVPRWDNTHVGSVGVTVDPSARRRGLGRRLFDAGVHRVRAAGRRVLLTSCFDHTAGMEFVKAMGLDQVHEEIHRSQDLVAADWPRLDREYRQAMAHAEGYELLRLPGAVPDDLLGGVARMTEAINDAPLGGLDIEDEVFSPERIRAFEAARPSGARLYRLVARERATGVLAGHTMVEVASDSPWEGGQLDTSVVRAHRGHRLGLLLKIAMLYWLREEEPQLRTLFTQNAATNAHMIRVNELLDYQVIAKSIEWQRHL
jgi:GNAT superfamily N-acetyltransferase